MVVAWTGEELAKLAGHRAAGARQRRADVHQIAPAELYAREPNLAPVRLGAVRVPGEHVIDAWSAPLAYALQAMSHGAQVRRGCRGEGGQLDEAALDSRHGTGPVCARVVINAAGLFRRP